jgi:hypothetical protein
MCRPNAASMNDVQIAGMNDAQAKSRAGLD